MRDFARNAAVLSQIVIMLLIPCGDLRAASRGLIPEVEAFIDSMVEKHDFSRHELRQWFSQAQTRGAIIRAVSRPATARPWYEFRASQVTDARIRRGVEFWDRYAATLARARAEYDVPEEVLVATIGVESVYGRNTGRFSAFDALVTLAFAYPPRAELFRAELEDYLLLARENQVSPLDYKGSYAGALGIPQFLPSSYRRYAVDFDGDGKRDLWNFDDAIGSIANYYRTWGWQPGEPVVVAVEQPGPETGDLQSLLDGGIAPHTLVSELTRAGLSPAAPIADDTLVALFSVESEAGTRYWLGLNNFYVITRYNRSVNYALAVYELAQELVRARQVNSDGK